MYKTTHPMTIERLSKSYLEAFARLTLELWPECYFEAELENAKQLLQSPKDAIFVAKDAQGSLIAFAAWSLRYDYVEGTDSSPVGYLEGIYVKPAYRKTGIARQLVESGAAWCKAKGCLEMASDAEMNNLTSHAFHQSLGFEEVNRIVCFRKDLV